MSEVKLQAINSLEIIENENIKKISSTIVGSNELIKELRANIKLDNIWSTFYLIQIFAERIADSIIRRENECLKKNIKELEFIKKYVEKNRSTLNKKIEILKKLKNSGNCNTKDFEILIKILELLTFIRNRFLFHVTNYDEYSFIYGQEVKYKKEEHLIDDFKELKEKIDFVMEEFDQGTLEWWLLERYSTFLGSSIKNYKQLVDRQKNYNARRTRGKTTVDNTGIYAPLIEILSRISFIFILFFGKEDLNLFAVRA
jgi:hypothetical protein